MNRRRFERIAVLVMSVIMLVTSTGIITSVAEEVTEASSVHSESASEVSTTLVTEGGKADSTTVSAEGGELVTPSKGTGKKSDPYQIDNADDFVRMSGKINMTTSADKYFVLTSDVDLSTLSADSFKKYSGCPAGVNKSLAKENSNVFFVLDGAGHKIKGLNISSNSSYAGLFLFINDKSTVKNLVLDSPVITDMKDSAVIGAVAVENRGTIENVQVINPVITVGNSKNTGAVAAYNYGTIENCLVKGKLPSTAAVSAEKYTVSGYGYVGGVCGSNYGKINRTSAVNVGMFISSSDSAASFGVIAGYTCSGITNCVVSGSINGSGEKIYAGGIAGRAYGSAEIKSSYVLVSLASKLNGYAAVGRDADAKMLDGVYWSSKVSGRSAVIKGNSSALNDIEYRKFIIASTSGPVSFGTADAGLFKWGGASFKMEGSYRINTSTVSLEESGADVKLTALKKDVASELTYSVGITLPDSVGYSGMKKLSQRLKTAVLSVDSSCTGDGTPEKPLTVLNSAELSFIKHVPSLCVKLGADMTAAGSLGNFRGVLDGAGHTLSIKDSLFKNTYGEVKNLKIQIKSNISGPVLGNICGARVSSVSVGMGKGICFNAGTSGTGVLAGSVASDSVIKGCSVSGRINVISDEINNSGALLGSISGDRVSVSQCGTNAEIVSASGNQGLGISGFSGSVTGSDVKIDSCYISGDNNCGKYIFVVSAGENKISVSNIFYSVSENSKAASKLYNTGKYNGLIDASAFSRWCFEDNNAFFSGKSGSFAIALPSLTAFNGADASDFTLSYNKDNISASVSAANGKAVIKISKPAKVVSVKAEKVTLVHKGTGLCASLYATNGLEKDAQGIYLVSNAYDLAFIGENVSTVGGASFRLTDNIDLSVISGYTPIGTVSCAFTGTFDGNGKTVSGLKLNSGTKLGLFGVVNGAVIKNVSVTGFDITSGAGYSGILCGQAEGKTVITDVKVTGSKLTSNGNYSGVIGGCSLSSEVVAENVYVSGCTVKSTGSYVGAVFGACSGNCSVRNVEVSSLNASGSKYVAGVAGLISDVSAISGVSVTGSKISGISQVSGVASGDGNRTGIKNVKISSTAVSASETSSAFTAAGVAAAFGSELENVEISSSSVKGGKASAVIGETSGSEKLTLKGIKVSGCNVSASGEASVSAGVVASHAAPCAAEFYDITVSADTQVTSEYYSAGFIGEINGISGKASADKIRISCAVSALSDEKGVASAVIARTDCASLGNVSFNNVVSDAVVRSEAAAAGFVGMLTGKAENVPEKAVLTNGILYPALTGSGENNTGLVTASVSGKGVPSGFYKNAFENTVCSTYFGNAGLFGSSTGLELASVYDMDKPDRKPIASSVKVINTYDEVTADISNLPALKGFVFDTEKLWNSNSDDRITVVSSTQDSAVLKAYHKGDVAVIGYYCSINDKSVSVPVHFEVSADIRTPLKGKGTKAEPYLVGSAYDLETVASYASENVFFALCSDIEFSDADYAFGGAFYNVGNGILTIGNAEKAFSGNFTGLYNGKIHTVSGLRTSGNILGGLFGNVKNASISDLILKDVEIQGSVYAGALAGKAENSDFSGIRIENASVKSVDKGGLAGGMFGLAENCSAGRVELVNVKVSGYSGDDNAVTSYAGGLAGSFSGSMENILVTGSDISGKSVTGGAVGILNGKTSVKDADIQAGLKSETAGGIAGTVPDGSVLNVSGVFIKGRLTAGSYCGGIAGAMGSAESDGKVGITAERVIVSAVMETKGDAGIAAGYTAGNIAENIGRISLDFNDVWYSSYTNPCEVFGSARMNSIQSSGNLINDINRVSCINNGEYIDYLAVGDTGVRLDDSTFTVCGKGYGQITVAGRKLNLAGIYPENENDAVIEDGVVLLKNQDGEARLILDYGDNFKAAAVMKKITTVHGDGVTVTGTVKDKTGAGLDDSVIAVMIKTSVENVSYSYDYFPDISEPVTEISLQSGSNAMFVNVLTAGNTDFSLTARDSDGNKLECVDAGAEGYMVKTAGSSDIRLEFTVFDSDSSVWGLQYIWGALAK